MKMGLKEEIDRIHQWEGPRKSGRVTHVIGFLITSLGPDSTLGELCTIYGKRGHKVLCQVIGFQEDKVLLMPLEEMGLISCGAEVFPWGTSPKIGVGEDLVGRVIDALGNPLDGKGNWGVERYLPVFSSPISPMERKRIQNPLPTGIKAIDTLCTIGEGQRMGIFSGSGVGKSTLLGMLAKQSKADVNVIALIGERGREVKEFIDKHLGFSGLNRSVVVVATSDQPALVRSLGAELATSIAEYFRDLGKKVLLLMDSITRFAMARREIGLATGEPPTTKGYPSSVYSILPRLLERAGNHQKGSITGIYTVLLESDDFYEPISDQMRSLVDGHIYLSRELATAGHYPSIDPLQSMSRLMPDLLEKEKIQMSNHLKEYIFHYKKAEDLINIGAYMPGSNSRVDTAIEKIGSIYSFLQQEKDAVVSFKRSWEKLKHIVGHEEI